MADKGPDTVKQKSHRERKSGVKAEKKKLKNPHEQVLTDKQKNPKAFTFNSAIGAERRFRRKQDIDTKKTHIPLVDRTPVEPPPILVAVVGPPQVGKSLVIQCLLKSFVNQPLTKILGPVTIVSGKKRRITFMECNNDINSMIDIAKVADLVLLLVDASFGFEMEIFEFLNICQVHGMPRIMGVLTHLDLLTNSRQLRKTKKTLKQRFWTEIYAGAKLFYLSGLMHDEYLRTEVKNLARFISVMKFRPLTWRTTHPYLMADRLEDLTPPEIIRQNSKIDRTISIYGYVRGVPLNKESSIHIPGCGDLRIKDVSFLPDPCPLPDKLKRRPLGDKERLIYAPFSGVGGVVYDKDGVYVELGGSHSHKEEDTGLMKGLIDAQGTLDQKLGQSELQLFRGTAPIKSQDVQQIFPTPYTQEDILDNGRIRRKVIFNDTEDKIDQAESSGESADEEDDEEAEEIIDSQLSGGVSKKRKNDGDDDLQAELKALRAENNSENKETENESSSSDESDDPEEEEKNKDQTVNEKLTKQPETEVKNKITEVLNHFDTITKQKKLEITPDDDAMEDDESFDELSDNDVGPQSNNDFSASEIDDNDNSDDDQFNWKDNLVVKARERFLDRQQQNNPERVVYGAQARKTEQQQPEEDTNDDVGGIFRVVSEQQKQKLEDRELKNQEESPYFSKDTPRDWLDDANKTLIVNRFVTGKWKECEDAEELLKIDAVEDDEMFGDFEDLTTGEKFKAKERWSKNYVKRAEENSNNDASMSEIAPPKELTAEETEEKQKLLDKKRKLKQQFDSEYDNAENKSYYDELKQEVEKQAQLNKSEFEGIDDEIRVQLEGYRPGMYVRVEIESVPCELIDNFDPSYPLIVGGLLHGEENIGFVQCRIKKHRWYGKILKTRDPLILSIGWRRFQTQPIFSKLEDNMRNRMLKYTPEHVACMSHFWGPITPQGTGILAIQDVATEIPGFRIAATGSIVELEKSTCVVKKLKLTGVPNKIYKKTAFIQGMFNSALEVAKFEGAKIKTVSGIRGQIKKTATKISEGCFRATFENKIQYSDIIFCRTWYKVDVPKFYNPVNSLLLPKDEKNQWRGMKTTGQLKRERGIHVLPNKDSLYTPIERQLKMYTPLSIPRNLQKDLPYRDKPKLKQLPENRKIKFTDKRVAVVRDANEERTAKLMKMIRTTYDHKELQVKQTMKKRMTEFGARIEAEELKKLARQKILKQQVHRAMSKMQAKEAKKKGKY